MLKLGKLSHEPKSYDPIAPFSSMFRLLGTLIGKRVSDIILEKIPIEQPRKNLYKSDNVIYDLYRSRLSIKSENINCT